MSSRYPWYLPRICGCAVSLKVFLIIVYMRVFLSKFFLRVAEYIAGQPVCFIYNRLKKYPNQSPDGYR